MEPEELFERLRASLPGEVAAVTDEEVEALLELARVAAHGAQRWCAPVSTYLAGAAVAALPAPERAAVLRRVAADLDAANLDATDVAAGSDGGADGPERDQGPS